MKEDDRPEWIDLIIDRPDPEKFPLVDVWDDKKYLTGHPDKVLSTVTPYCLWKPANILGWSGNITELRRKIKLHRDILIDIVLEDGSLWERTTSVGLDTSNDPSIRRVISWRSHVKGRIRTLEFIDQLIEGTND